MTTAKFEVGRTYAIERRHMGVWGERKVVSRTEKTITVLDEVSGQMAKRKLHTDERGEYIYLDSGTKKMRCSAVFVELFVKNETTGEWIYRGKKTMTKTELEGLYEALEGKTERTEIEVVLKKATVATLKEYMKKEMYFDESWKGWRKADFIEEISHYLENRALFSEVRESLEGITVSEEKIEKIADGIAEAIKTGAEEEEIFTAITEEVMTITQEGKTMTKMTVEQAAEAIQTAKTQDAIKSLLERLTKKDMAIAYWEIVGLPFYRNEDEMDRATLVDVIADDIWDALTWWIDKGLDEEIEKYHAGEQTANELDEILQKASIPALKEYAQKHWILLPPDDDRKEILKAIWGGILCDHFGNLEEEEYEIPYNI